jgi:hypothetical protein
MLVPFATVFLRPAHLPGQQQLTVFFSDACEFVHVRRMRVNFLLFSLIWLSETTVFLDQGNT